MQTREYTTFDKSGWKYAQNEPDKKQWQHNNGLACLIVRNHRGALCGYVGVPISHPYFGKGYNEIDNVEVHGGLSFSGECAESNDEAKGICHISDKEVWWLGFDCNHYGDISPLGEYPYFESKSTYKDFEYVTNEVNKLAEQLYIPS